MPNEDISSKHPNPLAVFSDFDGTISHPDTLNFLAESFGGKEFRREMGKKIARGEVSLRDGILEELAVIRGSFEEIMAYLKPRVEIDPGFAPFARWCEEKNIPLTVLSGGMKEVIEQLLEPLGLKNLKLLANRLVIREGRWSLEFLDDTHWGHDKGVSIHKAHAAGYRTVFLGDGLSDRGAAENADLVFTKGSLAKFCDSLGIPHQPFTSFTEVQAYLANLISQGFD
jgi:2,3-diketo-5-methylthio-1-phosphopentane phosphatase